MFLLDVYIIIDLDDILRLYVPLKEGHNRTDNWVISAIMGGLRACFRGDKEGM